MSDLEKIKTAFREAYNDPYLFGAKIIKIEKGVCICTWNHPTVLQDSGNVDRECSYQMARGTTEN